MTTLREAAQQALRDLEQAEATGACVYASTAALRTALAEQEPEPVGRFTRFNGEWKESPTGIPLYEHPPRRETEQEPVAWVDSAELKHLSDDFEPVISKRAVSEYDIPLFTHPPRREWRGLTEEDIWTLAAKHMDTVLGRLHFARAIEQACKERNT